MKNKTIFVVATIITIGAAQSVSGTERVLRLVRDGRCENHGDTQVCFAYASHREVTAVDGDAQLTARINAGSFEVYTKSEIDTWAGETTKQLTTLRDEVGVL